MNENSEIRQTFAQCINVLVCISELPSNSFANLPELTELNVEHCRLLTFRIPDKTALNLNLLQMKGNPLKCDCDSRWLWQNVRDGKKVPELVKNSSSQQEEKRRVWNVPRCATPYNVKNNQLKNLKGTNKVTCSMLETRVRFNCYLSIFKIYFLPF